MSLKKNVIANFVAQGWTSLMGIALVPLYIKYLGIESYGLIGVFVMMLAWLTLLDIGMTPTLTREMARYTAGAHNAESIRDLLRSLEIVGVIIATLIFIAAWFAAPWFAAHWLHATKLPIDKVAHAIAIMGFVVALRFIESLYRGTTLGLQQQVWISVVSSVLATIRGLGAVFVLMWISPTIEAFFVWQAVVSVLSMLIFIYGAYRHLPSTKQPARFSWFQLNNVWLFASGMMLTSLLTLILTQADKIILSRMLSLEIFGYYTLAGTVVSMLYQVTGPITQAYYPRFTELVTQDDIKVLIKIYHQSAQLLSVVSVPPALMLIFFGEKILMLWTGGNTAIAQHVAPIMALLALGTMLNGFMHIPYTLSVAYGWTGFSVRQNTIAVMLLVPAIILVTPHYGVIGAAWIWVLLNVGYVLIAAHYLYGRLLKTEKWHWYLYDISLPTLGPLVVAAALWAIMPHALPKLEELGALIGTGLLLLFASALTTPITRGIMFKMLVGRFYHASKLTEGSS